MQERARRAEYPIDRPGALKSLSPPFHPLLWRIKMRASAERPRGAFRVIRNPWGIRCYQEREGLIVLDVATVAGGDKAHLANGRNSNLKCQCEQPSPFYSNQIVFVFEFKCSRSASLPHQARSAQVSFPQKHSYVHLPFPVT
jgi:hypothetical protein